jgi:hypothetical protein
MKQMTAYDIEMQEQWLKQLKQQAEAIGGLTEDKEGHIKPIKFTDDDGHFIPTNGGIVNNFLDLSFQAADEAGDVYRAEAKSALVQFGTGVGGLGLSGLAYLKTSTSALDGQLEDAQSLQRSINNPAEKNEFEMKDFNPAAGSDQDIVNKKLKAWASGDKSTFEGYLKDQNGKPLDENTVRLNKIAAEQAKTSADHDAITKNLDEYINQLQGRIAQSSNKFNSMTNVIGQVTQAGNGIGSFEYKEDEASATQYSQSDSARAKIQENNLQQQTGYLSDAKQKADAFFQDAAAIASGYGQIVNTHA